MGIGDDDLGLEDAFYITDFEIVAGLIEGEDEDGNHVEQESLVLSLIGMVPSEGGEAMVTIVVPQVAWEAINHAATVAIVEYVSPAEMAPDKGGKD